MNNIRHLASVSSRVIVATCGSGAPAACPTEALQAFAGTFKGVLALLSFQGEALPLQNLTETHAIASCITLDADIRYFDPQTGEQTRQVAFSAAWDEVQGAFVLNGPVIHGVLRVLRDGQFVACFATAFAGVQAHCEEMITITNAGQQLMRSVQCAAFGADGASLGVRNALAARVL